MVLMRATSVEEMGKPGRMIRVKDGRKSYVLINAAGALYCLDGICMKDGCSLAEGKLNGYTLTCALHGAEFDIRTGFIIKNVQPRYGIAVNLKAYQVTVQGGEIFIEI